MRTGDDETRRDSLVAAWREMDERAALRLEQAAHRRIPRRRFAEPGGARDRADRAASTTEVDRASADGRLAADTPSSGSSCSRRKRSDADVSRPYPFFLAYPLEGAVEDLGDLARMAGRVEVGRHSRAADPPRSGARSSGRAAKS